MQRNLVKVLVKTMTWDMVDLEHRHPEKPGERHEELDHVEALVDIVDRWGGPERPRLQVLIPRSLARDYLRTPI